ncbi:anti-sigma-V factor RsiV [Oxobacter pfennigii]|uniref:Anti-sigma-V factor RsiV n=1 Tax=Oxobacter pfennigii TaxID=36849 RepID=A0A0N8NTH1_9CLOT|nr:RsiV family protein [Oxobacter pfennigii]KPU44816.1 anti-sigma-V factor RsiV [Oxobacter pfennigii]
MNNKDMNKLKNDYLNVPIPGNLDFVVKKAFEDNGVAKKVKRGNYVLKVSSLSAAVVLLVVTIGVNSSSAMASALSKIPVVGGIIKVLTIREYKIEDKNFHADIKVPSIEGLENEELQSSLNEKYLAENKKLYEQFMQDIEELKKNGEGKMGIDTGYKVMTDNDVLFSVQRYVVTIAASAAEKLKYDTIDKKDQVLITLPSLFKDESYIDIISQNIIDQMKESMEKDEGVIYWFEGGIDDEYIEPFRKISNEQNFYINGDYKLVISFDEYEVAPGYMGTPEFIIPTEAIADILVGNEYIK